MLQRSWIGSSLEGSPSPSPGYIVLGARHDESASGDYQHRPHRSEDPEYVARRFAPHINGSYESTKSIDAIRAFMRKNNTSWLFLLTARHALTCSRQLGGTRVSVAG